jgi:hypothetical protein
MGGCSGPFVLAEAAKHAFTTLRSDAVVAVCLPPILHLDRPGHLAIVQIFKDNGINDSRMIT